MNINTIYIDNKISVKRNILTIKKLHREVGRAKDLSTLLYNITIILRINYTIRSIMSIHDSNEIINNN